MKRRLYLIQCVFLLIIGVVLVILTFTVKEKNNWLEISKLLYFVFNILFQVKSFVLNKNEKIDNVDDEEIKRLLKEGKKVDAIKKIKEDNKCSLLNAIFYVGDIEKSLQ